MRALVRSLGSNAFPLDKQDQGRFLYLQVFVYLQMLDFLTTWVGIRMGAAEASPFISWLMHLSDPLTGLAAAKLIGFVVCGVCLWANRPRAIRMANYAFGVLVAWNLYNILLLTAMVPK